MFTLVDTLPWPAGYTDYGLSQNGRNSIYAFIDAAGALWLGWASHDPTYAVVNQLYAAKNDGHGWGAPALVYDEVANPPSWSGDFIEAPELYAGAFAILNDGSIQWVGNIDCVGVAIVPPANAPPPPPPPPAPNKAQIWNPGNAEMLLCDKHYPWIWAPSNRIPKSLRNSIPAPALNLETEIFAFQVPDGYYFVFDLVMNTYSGTNFIDGSGAILWLIDVNRPVGNPLPTGRPIAQFNSSEGSLERLVKTGTVQLKGNDVVRYKATIFDPMVGVGLPNMIHAAISGWLYPMARV
jgi:hypothetical protein